MVALTIECTESQHNATASSENIITKWRLKIEIR